MRLPALRFSLLPLFVALVLTACHGKDGKGKTKMGLKEDVKDYTDPKVQAEMTDEKAIKSIKEGIKDDKGKERMKAYGDQFSDDEIKSLVTFVRGFKSK